MLDHICNILGITPEEYQMLETAGFSFNIEMEEWNGLSSIPPSEEVSIYYPGVATRVSLSNAVSSENINLVRPIMALIEQFRKCQN